jgi:glucose-6-phosphate isomerase
MEYKFRHNTQSATEHTKHQRILEEYLAVLESMVDARVITSPESALTLPFVDATSIVSELHERIGKVRHVVLVGIGGSSLGSIAVASALTDTLSAELTLLDTLSDKHITRLALHVHASGLLPHDLAIVVISKSGSTTETITNITRLYTVFRERVGFDITPRIIVVTDPGSALDTLSREAGFVTCNLPRAVGGRFSIFSAVGVVPLTLLGVEVSDLMRGAQAGISHALSASEQIAHAVSTLSGEGPHRVLDTFVFDTDMRMYAEWRRQLIAESLGKKNIQQNGAVVMTGPLPTVSTSADLHSIAQLYLSGDRGIHTDFIITENEPDTPVGVSPFSSLIPDLASTSTQKVHKSLVHGVLSAYTQTGLSHATYTLNEVSAHEMGSLMAYNMVEVMCAAEVLAINAFDQPNVELYKKHMREHLFGNS